MLKVLKKPLSIFLRILKIDKVFETEKYSKMLSMDQGVNRYLALEIGLNTVEIDLNLRLGHWNWAL